ncbi:MAG: hypothetical protein ABIH46_05835, partial [Chloroflexota bacterium]
MSRSISMVSAIFVAALLAPSIPVVAQTSLPKYQIAVEVNWASSSLEAKETVHYLNSTGTVLRNIVFNVTPAHFGAFT